MRLKKMFTIGIAATVLMVGCQKSEQLQEKPVAPLSKTTSANSMNKSTITMNGLLVPFGSATVFTVLAGTTITNDGPSLIAQNIAVSPGSAITGFQPIPTNKIMGPGTVTAGLGVVTGVIYAGGPVAAQAHNDAVTAYNFLSSQVPDTTFAGVSQLNGLTFKPGIYRFAPSANLQVNGTVYLDFKGDSTSIFIFQMGTTLVTMAGSNVVAINNNTKTCASSNVYWTVGSSATINGAQFIGNLIATTSITMTSGSNVNGKIWALNGAVTMVTDTISVCSGNGVIVPPVTCRDFVTGGGWIKNNSDTHLHGKRECDRATFGVSGGIKNGKFWGQLSFNDHTKNATNVKSTKVTGYVVIDAVTRQIEGIAKINGKGAYTYKVIVTDNGEPGTVDSFSIELSNGYKASGNLKGGNIQLHLICGKNDGDNKEDDNDNDEKDGNNSCNNKD